MARVEFRFLQYVLSHVTRDRVSVALLHWDGHRLRIASSLEPLTVCEPAQRDAVRASVKVFVGRARALAKKLDAQQQVLDSGLADLFRVREGLGGALYWSPVAEIETRNPEAHFAELSRTARLDGKRRSEKRRFSTHALRKQLVELGEELKEAAPERVRVDKTVKVKKEYRSPLSWKNGRWHHLVPFSLDGLDTQQIDAEVTRLVGLVQLALPVDDVPVVVAIVPEQGDLATTTRKEAKLVRQTFADRNCELLTAKLKGREPELKGVRRRIQRDIG